MGFDVSTGASYAVLYSVLGVFTLLALGSAAWLDFLPHFLVRPCLLKSDYDLTHDYFLAARNSAGVWSIALSFFASGMGAWVLYGTTEMGATPALSWLGVLGYSFSSAFPAFAVCWLGPLIRAQSEEKAFSTTDFGRKRYGRVMQLAIAAVSGFYMFIYIVAELTSISNVFALLTVNDNSAYAIGITISLGAVTILYTTIAGLPASIVTDKFQGIIIAALVVTLTIAVTSVPANRVTRAEFALASQWTGQGAKAALTLWIAILSAELFNQCTWQRVWAAESVAVMRKGYLIGSVMVFLLMVFFGLMGMLAYAKDHEAYDSFEKFSWLSFFDIIEPLSGGWHIMVLVLVTALASSSIDSLQNGLTAIFYHDLIKIGWNTKWIVRFLMVAVNVPAIWMASAGHDVISLFLVADIVCATSVFPVFLGLQTKDNGIFKAPTELGAFLGCLSGISTVLVTGVLFNAEGGVWEYFWLQNKGICALCGNKTLISFIVTPIVSLIATYYFTFIDLMIRGERARQPIFAVAFDKDDDETAGGKETSNLESGAEDIEQLKEWDLPSIEKDYETVEA
jgi:solute:Na+ symporter, SSS family